jgi:putative effector of murein hydrolase
VLLARALGLPALMQQALGVKSVSSGFAIAIMNRLGGPPSLAAGLVIITGMIGAMLLPPMLKRARLGRDGPMGAGLGMAAHIIGSDALARTRPGAARIAALAMAMAGLVTAILLPLAWKWLF